MIGHTQKSSKDVAVILKTNTLKVQKNRNKEKEKDDKWQ